jgi:hypothetical protein
MESSQITLKVDALSTYIKQVPIKLRQMQCNDVQTPKEDLEAIDELAKELVKKMETLKLHTLQNYQHRNKIDDSV